MLAVQQALQDLEWDTGQPVFAEDSVFVTIAAPEDAYVNERSPQAHIAPGGMQADPDSHPRLISQEIEVRLVVVNASDGRGEGALMGAYRQGDFDSRGAGLLDLEDKLMDAMALMQSQQGISILLRASTAGKASLLPDGKYCAVRDYVFSTRITTTPG